MSVTSADSTATSAPAPMATPDVRLHQRGRVVDAVADHRDDPALVLERLDVGRLVLRQHFGDDRIDAELGRRRPRRGTAVPCQHDDVQSLAPEGGHRLGRARLHAVRHGQQRGGPAVDGHPDGRLAPPRDLVGGRSEAVLTDAAVLEQGGSADEDVFPIDLGFDAEAGSRHELPHLGEMQPPLLGGGHDGPAQGVLGPALGGGGQPKRLTFVRVPGENLRHGRLSGGQGARLVHDHGVDLVQALQGPRHSGRRFPARRPCPRPP